MSKSRNETIKIDPDIIRFTHSRIRPFFSGCGRRVESTLDDLIHGRLNIEDLPLITVLDTNGHFFSLNNRRLYVLKALRSHNLISSEGILVRVKPALAREKERYTPDRCSLHATLMREHESSGDNASDKQRTESAEAIKATLEGACILEAPSVSINDQSSSLPSTSSSGKGLRRKKGISHDLSQLLIEDTPIPLNPVVVKNMEKLAKLVARKKHAVVLEELNKWKSSDVISEAQRVEICSELGIFDT